MKVRIKQISVVVLLLFITAGVLYADVWFNNYDKALKAAEEQSWNDVIKYIQDALVDKPTPGNKLKTTGLRYIEYIPYYYLGLAYYKLDRCKEAVSAFRKEQEYGAVKSEKTKEQYLNLEKMISDCEKKLAPATQEQPQAVKTVSSKNIAIIDKHISDGDVFYDDEKFNEALNEYTVAKELIESTGERSSELSALKQKIEKVNIKIKAKGIIETAQRYSSEGRYNEAIREVKKIFAFDPQNAEAGRLLSLMEDLQKQSAQKQPAVAAVEQPAPAIEPETDYKKLLQESRMLFYDGNFKEARLKIEAVLQLKPDYPEAKKLQKDISYSQSIRNVNEGISNYFKGQVSKSKSSLQGAADFLSSSPEYKDKLVTAYLFLAAALIEEHFLEGKNSNELLNEAARYIQRIYQIKPGFKLDKDYFSPKISNIFDREKKK